MDHPGVASREQARKRSHGLLGTQGHIHLVQPLEGLWLKEAPLHRHGKEMEKEHLSCPVPQKMKAPSHLTSLAVSPLPLSLSSFDTRVSKEMYKMDTDAIR